MDLPRTKYFYINHSQDLEGQIYRLKKKTKLILKPGPRCMALVAKVTTNYPLKKNKFVREEFRDVPVSADSYDRISSSLNWEASILFEQAGTYRIVCSTVEGQHIWSANITVDPELKLPLDSIKCQTLLSKCLGPSSEWRKRITLTKDAGYNMVHFTPIQELGASNSAYSIRNQHKVNPKFKASLDDVKREVDFMERKWNILSVTDIVLNHTSNDSPWIREHPECSYNLSNSPHLRPAFLLDSAFIWLQQDLMSGRLLHTNSLSTSISSAKEVQTIAILLKTFYVPQLKIYELFLINVCDAMARFDLLPRDGFKVDYGQYCRNQAKLTSMPAHIKSPQELKEFLLAGNSEKRNEIKGYLDYAINNALSALTYERLNPEGPYFGLDVSWERPLVAPYFTHTPPQDFKITLEESLMYKSGSLFMANNGWIMGQSDTCDFIGPNDHVYLKRELIAWGDCIKLRYGDGPKDVPYLWDHMKKYVEGQAKLFHGFRIDNCHSTPLHVAEHFLDLARAVRPDIYLMAELFTSSEYRDNIYVNRLGITSLIRESMSVRNARELGRLMHRFGGTPVGAFYQHGVEPLKPGVAHAIFYDQTHDNESAVTRRSAEDVQATTAIINMANCATGSTRGYDELVPHQINVVTEDRLYPLNVDVNTVGILPLRREINVRLQELLAQGFDEVFVDQRNEDVIAMTRHNPTDGRSVVLVARTHFTKEQRPCPMAPISIQGIVKRILFEAQGHDTGEEFKRDPRFINGSSSFRTVLRTNFPPEESSMSNFVVVDGDRAEVHLDESQFLPSSVLAFEVVLSDTQSTCLKNLNQFDLDLGEFNLTLNDANYILFRCAEEDGQEPYALPNFCKFTYCGLQGLMYHLKKVRENQDQAHPLAVNLREGNWLSEYIVNRLRRRPNTLALAERLDVALKQVYLLPRGAVPKYFDLVVTRTYNSLIELIYSKMSPFVSKGPALVKLLALSSVALVGECESAALPPVDSGLSYLPSLAAGLPHFASGYMRNWGRDTFIAMRGLLLLTGRFMEAKSIILSYARTLNHGLIPNLLDGGENSRYNCRDATWWWLYSIREYVKLAPNSSGFLRSKVKRIHKPQRCRKRSVAQQNGYSDASVQQLCEIMQEALECHFKGHTFMEANAGKTLDEHMTTEGFEVSFGVDRETGFVFGGNEWNCGTWMDKMGSSVKAGTKGKPASPRDGTAVEIVGLSKAVISWLDDMFRNGRNYPYDGVECLYDNTITLKWSWKKWAGLIQENFEKHFYIPLEDETPLMPDPHQELVNKRGIYKDTVGASRTWQDYQLRPNFLVAMVVAPELFDKNHARQALSQVKKHLCGPLGMKTLDPSDWNYAGDYDNGNDSRVTKVAHGYNYHQGPEWLWLSGYYVRASSRFFGPGEREHHLRLLKNFYSILEETPWLGLPELTNSGGKFCPDSCPIQAWSVGTALEALYESVKNV